MADYKVYMHNVPKVGEDGKSIPIKPHQTADFEDLAAAQKTAAENKDRFERITVTDLSGEKERLVERYMDGLRTVIERKEEPAEEKAEEAAEEKAEEKEDA